MAEPQIWVIMQKNKMISYNKNASSGLT